MSRVVVVVAGGNVPQRIPALPNNPWIIGVDSGVGHALRLGLTVNEAIGDFDSIAAEHLTRIRNSGILIEEHPAEKAQTDLELALEAAIRRAPDKIILLGGHGGRFDHYLANVLLLASPQFAGCPIVAYMGEATITVVRHQARITGTVGELISLIPIHSAATKIRTAGLRYPLLDEDLVPGSTRGVSNEFVQTTATVSLESGALLAIQPGTAIR